MDCRLQLKSLLWFLQPIWIYNLSWIDRLFGPTLDRIGQWIAGHADEANDPVARFIDDEVALAFEKFDFEKDWNAFCDSLKKQEVSASKSAAWEAFSQMPADAVKKLLTLKKFDFKPDATEFDGLEVAGLIEVVRSRERYYSRLWVGAFVFASLVIAINLLMGDPIRDLLGFIIVVVILTFATDWLNRKVDGTPDVAGQISWTKAGLVFAENDLFPELNKYLKERRL